MLTTFLIYKYNSKEMTGILEIPLCEAFETGKEYYTCKVSATNKNGSSVFTYRITSANGNLPSLVIGGSANASRPWGCPFFGSWGSIACWVASVSNMNSNFNITLLSSVGNTFDSYRLVGDGVVSGGVVDEGIVHITIEADFPIFMGTPVRVGDNPDYVEYRPTNTPDLLTYTTEISNQNNILHINQAVNFLNVVNTIPSNQVWTARTHLKQNGSVIEATSKAYDFKIQPGAKIAFYITDKINGDASANAILQISKSPWLQKNAYAPDNTYTETSSLDSDYWSGEWMDYDNGDSYFGWFSTNIPCFRTAQDVQDYFDDKIGIDQAINGGDTTFHISSIGDDLSSTDIPTVNLATSGVGCFIYDLSVSDVKEIMSNYLYTDDASLKAEYVDALWMWGNNPIDFFIDLYYIPFSITNFYDTISAALKFGTYQIPDTSYDAVKEANGDRIELFNTSFEGIYGDWKDYTLFTYELYLPYVGFIELDPQKYVNHMVSCEMMFDITTHNLRYFIFSDGIISDRVDGSVGVNIPLMATDQVNKAKNDRNLKYGALTATVSGAASIGLGLTSKDVGGGISGVVSGISNIINAKKMYDDLNQKASQQVEGAFSSAMNIYDISYAYLKITEKGSIIPDKLHTLYGYPCYYMGKASALSGYCELSDIRLSGFTGTIDEANALKTILREGVIL